VGLWNWLRYGPFLAQVVVIRRCNLACGYCTEFDKSSEPVPVPDLEARFRKLRALGTWAVCLTGGEPSLHPQLPELVNMLTTLGFRRRQVITNGFRLTRELIEALNESGLTDMQISVDGVRPNETTKKTLEPLKERLALLEKYAAFQVVMSGVIGSAPPAEAIEVVDFARAHGFVPRILLIHDGTGRLELSPEERSAYREVKRKIRGRFEDADGYRERLIRDGRAPYKCRAGSRYLYVDEFGDVHWCSQTREAFSKALLDYDRVDLKRQFHTPKACHETCTLGCSRTASAYDGWRRQG